MKQGVTNMRHSLYPMNPFSLNLPLIVFGIGYEDNQPHVLRKEGFPLPQLFFCISGEGLLKTNNKTCCIKEGNFFYLLPDIPHEYWRITEKWELYWIAFSGNAALPLLDTLELDRCKTGTFSNKARTEALCRNIFTVLKTEEPEGKAAASSILYEMITELYAAGRVKKKKEQSPKENALLQIVKSYIHENYSKELTLAELSSLVHISPQYLCRLFQRYLNLRPFEYIAMKRIQQAKILLSDPNISVSEAASLTGYNNCSYFCSVFKKQERISPSEFRRRASY